MSVIHEGALSMMNWSNLLKCCRLGCPDDEKEHHPDRNEFQRDFDRVIFSAAFRRLHGKTQVFPFPKSDSIHTRLTHSLEASCVGRSLGTIVGNRLEQEQSHNVQGWELGEIVRVACLAHDIGNPPFGHSGEKAIAEFFRSERGRTILEKLPEGKQADFAHFDGNAMGFHILTHSNHNIKEVEGGYALTYPALAAFVKYPRPACVDSATKENTNEPAHGEAKPGKPASEKKPGLFQCDLENFEMIAQKLGIPPKHKPNMWYRHPLAFLTEAADDICYKIMDLEDGYKHNLVSYDETYELLMHICKMTPDVTNIDGLENIKENRNRIGFLRAKAINSLTYQVADAFIGRHEDILAGKYDEPLCDCIQAQPALKKIHEISKNEIYSHRPVRQVEAAGFQVLPGLLDAFLTALVDQKNKASSKRVLSLIPQEYIFEDDKKSYEAIMSITKYIAGMTDAFAVDTYRTLRGIQLPNY
jgi:dGTPase